MAKSNSVVAAVDVGYGFTKAMVKGKSPLIFPSVYIPARTRSFTSDIAGADKSWELSVGKRRYLVGDQAARQEREIIGTASRQRILSEETLIYVLAALTKLAPGGGTINLVTGLPHDWLRDKATLQTLLQGKHKVTLGSGETWTYNIANVAIMAQAFGTLAREMFEYNGHGFVVKDKRLLVEPSITVDFGRLTVGFMLYQDRDYQDSGSGSIPSGMVRVLEGLREDIFNQFDLQLALPAVDEALQKGFVVVGGKRHNVNALAQPHLERLIEMALSKAWSLWDNGLMYPHLRLTGGGAIKAGEMFREKYGHPGAAIVGAPQIANAEGMLIYGLWMSAEGRW